MKTFLLTAAALVSAAIADGEDLVSMIAKNHTVKATDVWQNGRRAVFDFEGYDAWVVEPPAGVKPSEGRPWTWTMQWRDAFVPRTGVPRLLERGWHHVSIDTFKDRMNEQGLAVSRRFQEYVVKTLGLAPKACLIGMSWGGFFRFAMRPEIRNVWRRFIWTVRSSTSVAPAVRLTSAPGKTTRRHAGRTIRECP